MHFLIKIKNCYLLVKQNINIKRSNSQTIAAISIWSLWLLSKLHISKITCISEHCDVDKVQGCSG